MSLSDRDRLVLLNLIPDVGSTCLRRLLETFGDLDRVWAAGVQELQRVTGIGPRIAQRIVDARRDDQRLRQELALAQHHGVTVITLDDAGYPAPLKTIPDPPLALYVRGALIPADEVAVAIVGARRASLYGLQCAERLGYDLALRGVTVVSGMALGIDGAAHRGALRAGGRTIAVLGNGLARLYPPDHRALAEQIAHAGALVSEYPMETAPLPHNFPRRNRLISGLSLGVVVVEASARSGALITADCALEQGREVCALPGPVTAVTSQGTHHLLKQGARLVTSVEDVLEELRLSPMPAAAPAQRMGPPVPGADRPAGDAEAASAPASERSVLACVREGEPRDIDAIVAESGLPIPEVSSLLLQLELKRLVQQLPGKRFVRRWS